MDKCTFWFNITSLVFDVASLTAVIVIAIFTGKTSKNQTSKELEMFGIIIGLLSASSSDINSNILDAIKKDIIPKLEIDEKMKKMFLNTNIASLKD